MLPASSSLPPPLAIVDWGRTRYEEAWKRQEEQVAARLAGAAPDTLIFTEHDPVFSIGLRQGAEQNLVWNDEVRVQEGISVIKTNRGGDVTYHGPGQIVGYPILHIECHKDLHEYLRFIEQVLIEAVAACGLQAARRPGKTGIWIEDRKVAAIGVAVKRWVTYHGFALNVNTRLEHFNGIVPCGIVASEGTVTSLQKELGHVLPENTVKDFLSTAFRRLLPRFYEGKPGLF